MSKKYILQYKRSPLSKKWYKWRQYDSEKSANKAKDHYIKKYKRLRDMYKLGFNYVFRVINNKDEK